MRSPARKSSKSKERPLLTPGQEDLKPFVDFLIGPDDDQRRAFLAIAQQQRGSTVKLPIADLLIGFLQDQNPEIRMRAQEAIASLGTGAIFALIMELNESEDSSYRLELAELVAAIVPTLADSVRQALAMELLFKINRDRRDGAYEVVWQALLRETGASKTRDAVRGRTSVPAPARGGNSHDSGDAADFKTYIFPLLFFKRISDVFDEEIAEALDDSGGDQQYALLDRRPRYSLEPPSHAQNRCHRTQRPLVFADTPDDVRR
jgi:hypothetical protein